MKVDWIAYLLPLGMLVAPLAYYHDSRASRTLAGTNVLVKDCEAAARDKSLVINLSYPKSDTAPPAVDARSLCRAD